jgi:hypothetical protein
MLRVGVLVVGALFAVAAQAAQVQHLNSQTATASGAGVGGTPSIASFNIPNGKNRILFIGASFERDHCSPADVTGGLATMSNTAGTGLGDNYPEPRTGTPPATTSNNQITAQIVGTGGTITKKNALVIGGSPSGDTRFLNLSRSPTGSPAGTALYSLSSFHIALFENEISSLLGGAASGNVSISFSDVSTPSNAGDDAILVASVFQNVEQTVNGVVRNATSTAQVTTGTAGNYSLAPASYDAGQVPDEADDGKLVLGVNASVEGFTTPASHVTLATPSVTNVGGQWDTADGNVFNEPNGYTVGFYFRNGGATPGSLYTLTAAGAAGTLTFGGLAASFLLESDNADTSDAPTSYGNATHTLAGIRLGASVDADVFSLNNTNATGDDINNTDDEDGVTIPALLLRGMTQTIPVSIQNASGFLSGWIDWNADGDFNDAGEQIVTAQAVAVGTTNLSVSVPAGATNGASFARFRVSTNNTAPDISSTPSGTVQSGEVEDYSVIIATPSNNADLSDLTLTAATINEAFAASTTSYTSTVPNSTTSVTVTPTVAQADATIQARVGTNAFATVTSGSPSASLALAEGANTIEVKVTAQDTTTIKTYTITVTRAAAAPAADYTVTTAAGVITLTDVAGNGDTLTVINQNPGATIKFSAPGRTFSVNGAAATTGDSGASGISRVGATSIVINAGAGNDVINIGSFANLPSLTINGGTGNDTVNFTSTIFFGDTANLNIDLQDDDASPGQDAINFLTATTTNYLNPSSATGSVTLRASQSITFGPASNFTIGAGNIIIEANQQATPTPGDFIGVDVNGAVLATTGGGSITIKGKGGNVPFNGSNTSNYGVRFTSDANVLSDVGPLTIEGVSRAGGDDSTGVYVDSSILSGYSDVTVTGSAVGTVAGVRQRGVELNGATGGFINAFGLANVVITGTGSAAATNSGSGNDGIFIETFSGVFTEDGNITLSGTGGQGTVATAGLNYNGIQLYGDVASSGLGNIALTGTAGITDADNFGIVISSANHFSGQSVIVATSGTVTLSGTSNGTDGFGLLLDSNGGNAVDTSTSGSDITLIADKIWLRDTNTTGEAVLKTSGAGIVTLKPLTASKVIQIGVADSSTFLGLTDTELDLVSAENITLGSATAGNIFFNGAISRSAKTNLTYISNGFIAASGNVPITTAGGNVTVTPGASQFFAASPQATNDLLGTPNGTFTVTSGRQMRCRVTSSTLYDKLVVLGNVDLTGAVLSMVDNSLGAYVPTAGQTFTLVDNDGTDLVTGTFSGLLEGATVSVNGVNKTLTYIGGDDNDVVLKGAVTPAPIVTNVFPPNGPTTGGTNITITGSNFIDVTGVTIGGTAATNVVVVNDGSITCDTPAHVAGAFAVLVTTLSGTNAPNSAFTFVAPNAAPTITSNGGGPTASIDVAENSMAVTNVFATDTDLPAQTITYSKSGTDAALFNIDSGTGVLSFIAAPDYEGPHGNIYTVTVTATDNGTPTNLSDSQDLTINVGNLNEMPSFTAGGNQSITSTTVTQSIPGWATAISDGDGGIQTLGFNVTEVGSSGLFTTAPVVNSSTGTLAFTPNGSLGTANFSITLADDTSINGDGALTTLAQTFSITITEAPSLVVTTASDVVSNSDGLTSLREAVTYANSNPDVSTITFSDGTGGSTDFTTAPADLVTLTTGAIFISTSLTIAGPGADQLTISGNNASRHFTVSGTRQDVSIQGMRLTGGAIAGNGGSISAANSGILHLQRLIIEGNTAVSAGALSVISRAVIVDECIVRNNTATAGNGGGANFNVGTHTIVRNSTFSGNTASGASGAFFIAQGSVYNTTISGNTANGASLGGGGVRVQAGTARVEFVSCTITGNSAPNAVSGARSGLWHETGTVILSNSIVAGNVAQDIQRDGTSVLVNGGGNLIGENTSVTTEFPAGVLVGTDVSPLSPGLDVLAANGGLTTTHALLPVSLALNAGSSPVVSESQWINLGSSAAGTFTLTFGGQTTSSLAFNAPVGTVQTALESLSTIGAGNVIVSGGAGSYAVYFIGALAGADQPAMVPVGLDGATVDLITMQNGGSFPFDQRGTGFPRLTGAAVDIGAYELQSLPAEIAVKGNGIEIPSGATNTPNVDDFTDFGTVTIRSIMAQRTFTIHNTGGSPLNLTGVELLVEITGANPEDFNVFTEPSVTSISGGASTSFVLAFDPLNAGLRTATVSISNSDSDENPYTFKVQGNGFRPVPIPLSSGFGDVVSGAFVPDATGANSGAKFDILKRGGSLAENGQLVFSGQLLVGTGGVTSTPNTYMGLWKDAGTGLKLLARTGDLAPDADGARFEKLPDVPAINDAGQVTFLAALAAGPGVTTANDTGVWSEIGSSTGPRLLVREGDDIPGLSGVKLGKFASGVYATARTGPTSGEAAFSVTFGGASTDTAILRTSVGPVATAVSVIARENTFMPGTSERFGNLASSYSDPGYMDPSGNFVFAALTKTNRESLWYQPVTGGAPIKVVMAGTSATGDVAPGTDGATFKSVKSPAIGTSGFITFRGFLNADGDNSGNLRNDGIWSGFANDTLFCLIRRGDQDIPGMPAGSKVGNMWHSWLNSHNKGAWIAWLDLNGDGSSSAASGDVRAIFSNIGGFMFMAMKNGDPAPGIPGATFVSTDLPVVGGPREGVEDDEYLAFIGTVTGGGTDASNNQGVWAQSDTGALTLLLRTGDTLTTSEGVKTIAKVDFPGSGSTARRWEQPVIDANGRVLIFVTFTDGSTSQVITPEGDSLGL